MRDQQRDPRPAVCAPPEPGDPPDERDAYAQAITNRLFSVGLDLYFVLGLTTHPEATARVSAAIGELDAVIKDFRNLVIRQETTGRH
ncbi:MAG TPA: hypothetical protein VGL93_32780 [Streptosporangiaceae bacterium]|jgi:hypothetical protein